MSRNMSGICIRKRWKKTIGKDSLRDWEQNWNKWNAKHVFQAINTWVVLTVRYSATIIEWMKEEVKEIDKKARKIITMYVGLHPRSNIEWLYLPKSEGGRELVSIENCENDERKNLVLYALRSNEKLIIAATKELKPKKFINVQNRHERGKQHLTEWKKNAVHG